MLMIIESINHWRYYLEKTWHKIKIINNHANLWYFMITIKLSCRQMKWINRLTAYNFKIFYQKKVSNFVNDSSRRLNNEKNIKKDERKFTHDLTYMRELLKNFLSQSASMLVIFTRQFKTSSIKNHERIVIRSFKKIINLLTFTKRIRKVSQTLKNFSTADEKSQWWFQNIIISRQKNICFHENIKLTFTTVVEIKRDICLCKNIKSTFITVVKTKENVCFCKNIESTFITVIEIKKMFIFAKTLSQHLLLLLKLKKTSAFAKTSSQCLSLLLKLRKMSFRWDENAEE